MDIRQLRHFLGVASRGNVSKAASAMNISQPALTRSVKMIEDELGAAMFVRTAKGVELTPSGATLARHAQLIVNSVDCAREEIIASQTNSKTSSSIGVANLFNEILVHKAITAVCKANPDFRYTVKVGLYEELAEMLRQGFLDLIFSTNSELSPQDGLSFERTGEVQSVLVVGASSNLAKAKSVALMDLRDAPWVLLDNAHSDRFLISIFASSGLNPPESVVRTSSLGMLRSLLREQYFIGWLPSPWARIDVEAGVLKALDLPQTTVSRPFGIVTREQALLRESAQALIAQLKRTDIRSD